MKEQQKSMLVMAMITAFITAGLLLPAIVGAGDLEPTAGPDDPGSAMYTIEDIYNYLDTGVLGTKRSSEFAEPIATPGSTMHTLDEIMGKAPALDNVNGAAPNEVLSGKTYWGLRTNGAWGSQTGTGALAALPAPVEKTGQTGCWDALGNSVSCTGTGQDGELQKGITWPNPRFTDNTDSTVTDNLTGFMWLKDANCIYSNYSGFDTDATAGDGRVTWQNALNFVAGINDGTYPNCGGGYTDWRLPNVKELQSLIDFGEYNPALSYGHPFTGVQSLYYWSSTTWAGITNYAWDVSITSGLMYNYVKTYSYYVWPVRGGN